MEEPRPGSTPTAVPRTHPTITHSRLKMPVVIARLAASARVEDGRLTIAGMSRDDDSGLGDLVTDVARRVRSSLDPASGRIPRS